MEKAAALARSLKEFLQPGQSQKLINKKVLLVAMSIAIMMNIVMLLIVMMSVCIILLVN